MDWLDAETAERDKAIYAAYRAHTSLRHGRITNEQVDGALRGALWEATSRAEQQFHDEPYFLSWPLPPSLPSSFFTGALAHTFATELAALYYPSQLKTAVTRIGPIQWKGGFYRDLLKSITADPSACVISRSILVSSQLGKASRRCLRTRSMPAILATAGVTQVGGIPGRGTGHASVIIRLAQAVAAARALSFGALFLDVVQAFYRTLRELLLRSPLDDDAVACIV
ncbi:unnamed protein product, partial [Prorocentrum cordatum]